MHHKWLQILLRASRGGFIDPIDVVLVLSIPDGSLCSDRLLCMSDGVDPLGSGRDLDRFVLPRQ